MENTTTVTTFILSGYYGMKDWKHANFIIFFVLYIAILLLNTLLIVVIYRERELHEPMYIFLCSLSFNGIYGSTSLMPHLLSKVVSQFPRISLVCCLIQIYCLHTFNVVELTTLAIMAYDRYIAICYPLHYHNIMSSKRIYSLIVFSWIYPLAVFALYLTMTIRLSFCSGVIHKTHCANFDLVRLSCTDISIHSKVGLGTIPVFMLFQILLILFSYVQILRICLRSSRQCQMKALKTCTPHLFAVINYFIGCFFEIAQSRLNQSNFSYEFRIFMSLYFLILPPLLNPIIYGVSSQVIKAHILLTFFQKKK